MKHRQLATFFNFEISGLADRFLMEIEENVNSGWENGSLERYVLVPFEAGTLVILVQRLHGTGQPKQIMAPQYIGEPSPGPTQRNGSVVIRRL